MTTVRGSLWKVVAHESCDSSGGCVVFFVATDDVAVLPDVYAAFRRLRHRDSCSLYMIDSVTRVDRCEPVGEGATLDDVDDQRTIVRALPLSVVAE